MKENKDIPEFEKKYEALRSTPFSVPEGYFEKLSSDIAGKVVASRPESLPMFRINNMRLLVPVAATIALLIAMFFITRSTIEKDDGLLLTEENLMEYFSSNYALYDISDDLLIEMIAEQASYSAQTGDIINGDFDTDEQFILNYLSDYEIEELIYEQYL